MAFCVNCGKQLIEGAKFCAKCGHPIDGSPTQPQQQVDPEYQEYQRQQAYQQPQYVAQPQAQPIKPDSNMILAILTTIFCCLPTGIYAIVQANKVDSLYYSGRYEEAEEASQSAKKWSIIGGILATVGILLYIVFVVLLAAGAAAGAF